MNKVTEQKWYKKCKDRIKRYEGFVPHPYFDQKGKRTVFYGRNIELNVMRGRAPSINAKELIFALEHLDDPLAIGEYILDDDLKAVYLDLVAFYGGSYERDAVYYDDFDKLPDNCKIALCDMAYNMGMGGLLGFENMLTAIDQKDWEMAYKECLDSNYGRDKDSKVRAMANAKLLLSCKGV